MPHAIVAKGFDLTESIKDFSQAEIQKAIRVICADISSFRVTATAVHNKTKFSVECNVSFKDGHKSIAVSSEGEDLYGTIQEAITKVIEIADKNHKKEITEKKHRKRPEPIEDSEKFDED